MGYSLPSHWLLRTPFFAVLKKQFAYSLHFEGRRGIRNPYASKDLEDLMALLDGSSDSSVTDGEPAYQFP